VTFTAEQLAACAEWEVKQRRRVYPQRVDDGYMSQDLANIQIAMMEQFAREYRAKAIAEAAKDGLFGGEPCP